MALSDFSALALAPVGNPVEYVFNLASLSHSWPDVASCVMAFVVLSYVVVLEVTVCRAAASCVPVYAYSGIAKD